MNRKIKPELSLLGAMLVFGSVGIFVKHINLPSTAIVLWRTIIGSVFLGLVFLLTGRPINTEGIKANLLILIAAGIALGSNWALLFEAFHLTTVSIAILLHYTAPAIVFMLSPLLFKERITTGKVVGIVAAIAGMVIINAFDMGSAGLSTGVLCALASALLYATLMILNKQLSDLSGLESTFVQLVIAMIVMAIYTGISTGQILHLPRGNEILLVATVGVLHTGIACYVYFSCMQQLPGQTVAIMSYLDPASTLVFSAVLLQERLTLLQIIGACLILGGTAYSQLAKHEPVPDSP